MRQGLRTSHKADIECLAHALDQIEYASSGEAFTSRTRDVLLVIRMSLKRVIATERARRKARHA